MWAQRVIPIGEQTTEENEESIPTFYNSSNTDPEANSEIFTCQNEPSDEQKILEPFDHNETKCPPSLASQCGKQKNLNSKAIFLDVIDKLNKTTEDLKRELLAVQAAFRGYDENAVSTKTELASLKKRFDRVYGKKI